MQSTIHSRTPPSLSKAAAPTTSGVRWYGRALTHLLLLAAVVLLAYWGMWQAYFATLDDFGITGWVRSRANLWVAIQGYGSGVRFLNYLPIWFKSQWFGLNAAPYLLSGLAQYLVVVWLVYALARHITKRAVLSLATAIFFAVAYHHYEVVTYVSASDYTWWAAFYLGALLLFLRSLAKRADQQRAQRVRSSYIGALLAYSCLAFGHDFTLNLPLVLLAAHLILYVDLRQLLVASWPERLQQGWQIVRLHLPFWLLWTAHVALQLLLVMGGTSEAVYSVNGYAPGLHMVANLRYLIFLWLPNIMLGPIYSFLSDHLSTTWLTMIWQGSMVLGTLLHIVLLWVFLRGRTAVRFAIALIYLPFLQYTPWQGHFIEAPRYLLLPSVGGALLLALAIDALCQHRLFSPKSRGRQLLVGSLLLFCLANIAVLQVWIGQHIENGEFRRGFVTALHNEYYTVMGPDAFVWIEVPEEKYTDLADACRLVFDEYFVRCLTYVADGPTPTAQSAIPADRTFYWLQATADGIVELHSDADKADPLR